MSLNLDVFQFVICCNSKLAVCHCSTVVGFQGVAENNRCKKIKMNEEVIGIYYCCTAAIAKIQILPNLVQALEDITLLTSSKVRQDMKL